MGKARFGSMAKEALSSTPDPVAGQVGPSTASTWSFRDSYLEHVSKPKWRWDLSVITPMQNILVSGGAGVRENILKRQETYGVAFALILGCALAVMALAGNQQGPDAVCNIGPKEIKDQCWTQQFASGVSVGTSLLIEICLGQHCLCQHHFRTSPRIRRLPLSMDVLVGYWFRCPYLSVLNDRSYRAFHQHQHARKRNDELLAFFVCVCIHGPYTTYHAGPRLVPTLCKTDYCSPQRFKTFP